MLVVQILSRLRKPRTRGGHAVCEHPEGGGARDDAGGERSAMNNNGQDGRHEPGDTVRLERRHGPGDTVRLEIGPRRFSQSMPVHSVHNSPEQGGLP